jgi:hypothetical protein
MMADKMKDAREFRRWLKIEWADLWKSKFDDEIVAEGISLRDYSLLDVDKGEIIHASRDYKPLKFREILEKNLGGEVTERVDIDPKIGGWKKFVREKFPIREKKTARDAPKIPFDLGQQQRKGGSGWLNQARIRKKVKAGLDS